LEAVGPFLAEVFFQAEEFWQGIADLRVKFEEMKEGKGQA